MKYIYWPRDKKRFQTVDQFYIKPTCCKLIDDDDKASIIP